MAIPFAFSRRVAAHARIHAVPSHLLTLFERLTKDGEAFVEADKLGLFTTSWQIIAQKPAAEATRSL